MQYVKLFSSIIHSTIWRADNATRIVWITLLAMADFDGKVEASLPGLADAARVSIDECKSALDKLASPDPYSRSPEHEGRRIAEIDGGWFILNHAKYRNKKTGRAEYYRQWRSRKKQENSLPDSATRNVAQRCATQSATHTDTDTDTDNKTPPTPPKKGGRSVTDLFDIFWQAYPRKVGKGAARKAWSKIKPTQSLLTQMQKTLDWQTKSEEWKKESGRYIPNPATWLNQCRWEDEPPSRQRASPYRSCACGRPIGQPGKQECIMCETRRIQCELDNKRTTQF